MKSRESTKQTSVTKKIIPLSDVFTLCETLRNFFNSTDTKFNFHQLYHIYDSCHRLREITTKLKNGKIDFKDDARKSQSSAASFHAFAGLSRLEQTVMINELLVQAMRKLRIDYPLQIIDIKIIHNENIMATKAEVAAAVIETKTAFINAIKEPKPLRASKARFFDPETVEKAHNQPELEGMSMNKLSGVVNL